MSKYKIGDKVVLEITDKVEVTEEPWYILSDATSIYVPYLDKAAETLSTYTEQARAEGQNEAWELARKIVSDIYHGGYNSDELKEIFGYFLYQNIWEDYTYQEAAAKVAQWEKAKEEIKVGDVYKSLSGNFVVCGIDREKDMVKALWDDLSVGKIYLYEIKEQYTKTGRHIDLDSFLRQIGGEENESNL